jgi:hypothetical protein
MGDKSRTKKEEMDLPTKISIASLALLLGLTERGASTLIDLLELGNSRMGMAGAIEKGLRKGSFWDYYRELKELKENSARTILWRLQKKGLVEKKEDRYRLTFWGGKFRQKIPRKKIRKTMGWQMANYNV